LLRFRLTVSLLRCRDGSIVEIFLSGPLPPSLVVFLVCGLRLVAAAVGSLCAVALAIDCTPAVIVVADLGTPVLPR
jgi:hypothetical protein